MCCLLSEVLLSLWPTPGDSCSHLPFLSFFLSQRPTLAARRPQNRRRVRPHPSSVWWKHPRSLWSGRGLKSLSFASFTAPTSTTSVPSRGCWGRRRASRYCLKVAGASSGPPFVHRWQPLAVPWAGPSGAKLSQAQPPCVCAARPCSKSPDTAPREGWAWQCLGTCRPPCWLLISVFDHRLVLNVSAHSYLLFLVPAFSSTCVSVS